jgi:uncharacterized protein (TIGR02147 family)
MPELFTYTDYRAFLRDFFEERREENAFFSLRYSQQKTGLDAGNLVKILQGERHLPKRYIDPFIELCGLKGRRALYFSVLVRYSRTKSNVEAREHFEQLAELKRAPSRTIESQQYDYFKSWHYAALRSLLDYYDFKGDYGALGAQLDPPVSPTEAKRAIEVLRSLGLIEKHAGGVFKPTDKIVTTGERWQSFAIESLQERIIELGRESLKRFPKERRDISTVTMSISSDDFRKIRTIIQECRRQILKVVHESEKAEGVYQLTMQLFPLTKETKRKSPS